MPTVIHDPSVPSYKLAVNSDGSINTVSSAGSGSTAPTNSTVTADAASKVIKASSGTLFELTGHNGSSSAQYIQLHNAAALPSDTAVPAVVFKVPADTSFSLDYDRGRAFSTGIVVCNSSTRATKTIGSADCWFDAQYV